MPSSHRLASMHASTPGGYVPYGGYLAWADGVPACDTTVIPPWGCPAAARVIACTVAVKLLYGGGEAHIICIHYYLF